VRCSGKIFAISDTASTGSPLNRKTSAPQHKNTQTQLQKPWTKAKPGSVKVSEAKTAAPKTVSAKVLKQNRQEEAKIYGENACRVAFLQRPEALVRLYLSEQMAPKFADLMKYLAAHKKAYHVVSEAELEKVAGSQHHGGVVLLAKRKAVLSLASYLTHNSRKKQDCLLALDGVGNPHNLGAIARSCAHFGISGIVMKDPELLAHGAAARTAEGGVEFVEGLSCDNLPLALQLCKQAGYTLVTTSSHGGVSLYGSQLPAKVVIVFGEEMFGVSQSVAKSADIALQIPGTGKVESLNVSVAASLILCEWYRQQQ
jgi:TrmH RNA methyltransferase